MNKTEEERRKFVDQIEEISDSNKKGNRNYKRKAKKYAGQKQATLSERGKKIDLKQ